MINGKWDGTPLPEAVVEHLFCKGYGYTLDEFRRISVADVQRHLPLLIISHKMGAARG